MEPIKTILTEKHQQFGYHSTTFGHLAKFLADGKLYFSKINDDNIKDTTSDDFKNKIINKGFHYFLSTHNTHKNTVRNKHFLPVTLKINFNKFMTANDFFNGVDLIKKDMNFQKKVDSVQYPFDDINKNQKEIQDKIINLYKQNNIIYIDDKYEYEDRMMTNHSNIDLSNGCVEECHILFNKEALDFTINNSGFAQDALYQIQTIVEHYNDYNIKFIFYSDLTSFNSLSQTSSSIYSYILTKGIVESFKQIYRNNDNIKQEVINILSTIQNKFDHRELMKKAIIDGKNS